MASRSMLPEDVPVVASDIAETPRSVSSLSSSTDKVTADPLLRMVPPKNFENIVQPASLITNEIVVDTGAEINDASNLNVITNDSAVETIRDAELTKASVPIADDMMIVTTDGDELENRFDESASSNDYNSTTTDIVADANKKPREIGESRTSGVNTVIPSGDSIPPVQRLHSDKKRKNDDVRNDEDNTYGTTIKCRHYTLFDGSVKCVKCCIPFKTLFCTYKSKRMFTRRNRAREHSSPGTFNNSDSSMSK